MRLRCRNTGQAEWLDREAYKNYGSVYVGPHLYDGNMRLLNFEAGRHPLPGPVAPGAKVDLTVEMGPLPAGEYVLTFDLVAEYVTWFESLGATPPQARVRVD